MKHQTGLRHCKTCTIPPPSILKAILVPQIKKISEPKQIKIKRTIMSTEIFPYEKPNMKVLAILMFPQFRMSLNN